MGKTYSSLLKYQVLAGAFAILINLLFADVIYEFRFWILGLVILIIGMPHGALDHIIAFKAYKVPKNSKTQWIFYLSYLGVIVLYGIFWIFFPLLSFAFFLMMTLYHFGQADAERFSFSGISKSILLYSRGLTVVGLILFGSDPYYSSSIIEEVTGFSLVNNVFAFIGPGYLTLFFVLLYPLCYLAIIAIKEPQLVTSWFTLDAVIVSLIFSLCEPIFAFSVYFGVWHAFNHSKTMMEFISQYGQETSFIWFYKNTFLYSIISYAGLGILYFILEAFGNQELLVALLFILISVLTLPHMFVVEKMYENFYSTE
ncbi:Brp/Blh family beta-carotene 15,15'-dioxygenase [Gracilimonas sp.]|uniref:Brp/Blh family beta-carotene 15,15'-dioxygenase n=1 Tax=Gracilimonas sp. TaxID=1974203 RepID=UPI00287264DC|nr:Brp/Blh family beta-carotene 15,15'-dioxygenase [Gracilimonas sp.]